MAAHLYNSSAQLHGQNEAIMTCKDLNAMQREALVYDIERGRAADILPYPWQTDTCIGNWHYERSLLDKHQYKTAPTVVRMLCDIVSKNGNLMLNIPVRGDGTIDYDEQTVLEGIAGWMSVNQECIFGTRPWTIFGEGPSNSQEQKGRFGGLRDTGKAYTSRDIRFTTKDGNLYAIAMEWPADGQIVIHSLAKIPGASSTNTIKKVALLGNKSKLEWTQTESGLTVKLPADAKAGYTCVLRVSGKEFKPAS
jgi:alpha-L-fucosidase